MDGVRKSFGATRALDGVDFAVRAGEVHALIGENGAGKSTLMKVLSGVYGADGGTMQIDGRGYEPANPLDARQQGVAMIYQELAIAPHLSVAANVLLGIEPSRQGRLDHAEALRRTKQALEDLGQSDIDPADPAGSLSVGAQQLVEVARALVTDARIIVFDEPTSSLTRPNVERLFQVIRRLSERGVAVVYISHFLEEVAEVADAFTVLRDGKTAGSGTVGQISNARIIHWMIGRKLNDMFPRVPHEIGEPVLELTGLEAPGVTSASLRLRRGEVCGIAGLIGAGRTELLRAVSAWLRSAAARSVSQATADPLLRPSGFPTASGCSAKTARTRVSRRILPSRTTSCFRTFGSYSRRGWLDRGAMRRSAGAWIDRLRVKTSSSAAPVHSLSGGNQQKVQLARLLHHDCDVLFAR